jgi:hypothetical protein
LQLFVRVTRRRGGDRWRSGVRSRRRRQHRRRIAWLLAPVLLAMCAVALEHRQRVDGTVEVAGRVPAASIEVAVSGPVAREPVHAVRPTFRYSIIPGGAYSAAELQAAIGSDHVVAQHYEEFDPRRVRLVRLAEPMLAFISYRMGSEVFWTRTRRIIPAGEAVLTDGVHSARARCGNRISDTGGATSLSEPPAEAMETPIDVPLPLVPVGFAARLGAYLPVQERVSVPGGMMLLPPDPHGTVVLPPGIETPHEPEVPVRDAPEPAAAWLLLTGVVAFGVVCRRARA